MKKSEDTEKNTVCSLLLTPGPQKYMVWRKVLKPHSLSCLSDKFVLMNQKDIMFVLYVKKIVISM
jgi:hypothetical protein